MAVHHRPGAYAILLGSGISTAAQVPTGWQVVKHLARSVAAIENADVSDPVAWYEERFGTDVTYSGLIGALGRTEAERQAIVVDALTSGTKRFPPPTPAHQSLAALVAGGWIKVILTTNFDPLLEDALTATGVEFQTLSSRDQIAGALPLAHAGVVVVKLHGDYRDLHIRNTDDELTQYPQPVDELLDRVFDEYGLIICGWSADHDRALCNALDRSTNRRFATYWAAHGGVLRPSAEALADRRGAEIVPVADADSFFGRLRDAVESLRDLDYVQDEPPALIVASLKRDLSGGVAAISAHDRVRRVITKANAFADGLDAEHGSWSDELLRATPDLEALGAVVATLAYWGDERTDQWWIGEIAQFTRRRSEGGYPRVLDLARVPGLVMAWAAGIAAVAKSRNDLLTRLLGLPSVPEPNGSDLATPVLQLDPGMLKLDSDVAWIFHRLNATFAEHLAFGKTGYAEAFDRWQYTLAVAGQAAQRFWPAERFLIVDGYNPIAPVAHHWMASALDAEGAAHPLVASGIAGATGSSAIGLVAAASTTYANNYEATAKSADMASSGGGAPSGRHYPGSRSSDPEIALRDPLPPPGS
jgi:hypothetical protein